MKKAPTDNQHRFEDALLRWENEGGKREGDEIEHALQMEGPQSINTEIGHLQMQMQMKTRNSIE